MPTIEKHALGQILMMTLQDFQRRLDADLADKGFAGIRQRHRSVFVHLNRYGASRSVDLARAAGIRPQSMMKIVHELEELGLLQRRADPQDSRAKLIEYTAQGESLLRQLSRSTERVWNDYAQVLGQQQLDQLLTQLSRLLSEAEEEASHE